MPQLSVSLDATPTTEAQWFTQLCAGAGFGIALLAAAGWLFHARFLAGQWGGRIPMSPSTALALLLLSGAVLSHGRRSEHWLGRRLVLALGGLPALLGLLVLAQFFTGFDSGVEWVLSRTNEFAGQIPLGRMSPLTAGAFVLESATLILLLHAPRWRFAASGAALFALLGCAGGLVVSVGYAYGAPLLYGGASIPMALPTALSFVLVGAGEISLALGGVAALRSWSGDSTRGVLLRSFLPAMLLFILVEDWLAAVPAASLNPALLHSLTALLVCVVIVVMTGWTARRVGDALDRARETLRSSEERFKHLFQQSAAGMVIVSPSFCFLQVNDAFCKMLGYTEAELMGRTLQDVTKPEDQPVSSELVRRVLSGEIETFHFEKRYLRKDGDVAWGLVSASVIRGPQNQPLHLVAQIQDITEHKRAEEALRESESQNRELFESSSDALFVIATDTGQIMDANDMASAAYGYDRDELLARKSTDLSAEPEDTHRRVQEAHTKPGQVFRIPLRLHRKKDGTVFPVEITARSFVREKQVLLLVSSRDITERKRAEEELRASEERSRTLVRALQCASECISITDTENRILFVNDEFIRTYGYGEHELIGQNISVLRSARTSPEVYDEVLPTTMAGSWCGELWNRTKGGRDFPISLATSVVYDEGGQTVALVGIARDMTERKRAEEERSTLQAQLQQAQKMESIGRLAGGVAHDFNNMLTVINGYSQMLLSNLGAGDPLRDTLAEIYNAGERAAGLTRQLLAFSRKQVLEPRRLDVNRLVEEMRPMLERLVGEDIEVSVALHAEGGMIYADSHQLEQVVMNLVVNARDAMPGVGKLLVETDNVERDESYTRSHLEARVGRYVVLAVSDTGVGMDEETKNRIFEPFFTTKGIGKGTGLGLSMVQGIVAQSGGYVDVYSEQGRGTTFKIFMPALAEGAADAGRPAAVPVLGGKETVLVVEDQAEVRKFAVAVLKSYGYRVIPAEHAGEALLLCERERIDLVLTDVVMPHVSGRELADRLETLQPGIKVLFMSGYTDNVIESHGVLEEGVKFIQKPFSSEDLAGKVRAVLGMTVQATRILVAADEAGVRGFLRAVLEDGGHEVIEAVDGKQALQQARAGQVDLVITDLVMPEQEGIETIRALRREVPGVGIIAISGALEGQFLKVAEMLGADAVLNKPVSAEVLLAKVVEVLKTRR